MADVLVVEDAPEYSLALKLLLERAGHSVAWSRCATPRPLR